MTTTTNTDTPAIATPAPTGAVHLGEWQPDEDEQRFAHRWFHCGERSTPGGLRLKTQGVQYADGSIDELAIALTDEKGNTVMVDADDAEHLAAQLTTV